MQQGQEHRFQHTQPGRDMRDHTGNATDQQDAKYRRVERFARQQPEDQQCHQRPVAGTQYHLAQRKAQRRQRYLMLAPAPGSLFGETTGQQVACGNRQQYQADQLQAGGAHRPVGGQLDQAQGEHRASQQHVAHPVGQQAQGEDARDGCGVQAQAAIQPVAQGDAAHPSGEIEVERIAHEGHWQHLASR